MLTTNLMYNKRNIHTQVNITMITKQQKLTNMKSKTFIVEGRLIYRLPDVPDTVAQSN